MLLLFDKALMEDSLLDLWLQAWKAHPDESLAQSAEDLSAPTPPLTPGPANQEELESLQTKLASLISPFSAEKPAAGQIRMFSSTVIDAGRPYCVALLKVENTRILLAPLSRFSVPATEYELQLAEPADSRGTPNVINLRQAVWVEQEALKKTWDAGQLSPQQCMDSLTILDEYQASRQPGPEFLGRVGARFTGRASDPRRLYEEQEARLLQALSGERVVVRSNLVDLASLLAAAHQADETGIRLVADDTVRSAPVAIVEVPAHGALIDFVWNEEENTVYLQVFDSEGNFSDTLNGCLLLSADGTRLAAIQGHGGTLDALPRGGLRLASPDGTALDLRPLHR
jgi:hypothetical protein